MDFQNNQIDELSDTGYSEDDPVEVFLNLKNHKSVKKAKKYENLECTKVIEIFVTTNGTAFAHCCICLYKTEIKNMNCVLEHFINIHAVHCQYNKNLENLEGACNSFKEINSFKSDISCHNNNMAEAEVFNKNYSKEKYLNSRIEYNEIKITDNISPKWNYEKIEDLYDNKYKNTNEKTFKEIDKLTQGDNFIIGEFENNFTYSDTSESEQKNFSPDHENSYDSIMFEENYKFNDEKELKNDREVKTEMKTEICYSTKILESENIQKQDEKFYHQLARLDPDQSLCHLCNTKFRYISRHYKNQHPDIILCEISKCYQTFNSLPELNSHCERFHSDPKYAFTCTICQYKANNLNHFRFHYQRIHLNIKDFNCDFCEMKFFSNYEKTKHMRCHTGQKPYKCKICDSKYITKQQLNLHIQKYHSDPQFECNVCGKKFHRKQTLKEHQITKHTLTEKKEICEICGDRFFLRKQWKEHFNNIHNPDRKRWTCNECGKSFSRNSNLRDHKITHNIK